MKIVFFLAALFLGSLSMANPGKIVVYGEVEHFKGSSVDFSYEVFQLLQKQTVKKVAVDNTGRFSFTLDADAPLKGFFAFGKVPVTYTFTFQLVNGKDSTAESGTSDPRLVFLYLQPGDTVHMKADINNIEQTLQFSGNATGNNIFVNQEEFILNKYKERFLRNYYEPFSRLPDAYPEAAEKRKTVKMRFLDSMAIRYRLSPSLIGIYYWKFYAESVTSRMYYPEMRENYTSKEVILPAGYFDFIKEVKTADEGGNKGIGYFYFLDALMRKKYEMREDTTLRFAAYVKQTLSGKAEYEYLAYALGKNFTPEILDMFGNDSPYPDIAKLVKSRYAHLKGMIPGSPVPPVKLLTTDGKAASFADYKGKYLYVDFWATWCGPCIKEIPSLIKLEKEYRGKDITFLSISFDKDEDEQKWKDYVKKNIMTGIQFRADAAGHTLLTSNWNISMIPRFVILDKKGNVVDANAPFPSSNEIRKALNDLL